MATVIATKSSANGTSGDVTVTKPTSLAEGDIMVAFVTSSTSGVSGEAPHNLPSGWTELGSVGDSSNNTVLTVAAVVATSTQTAASDFSFTSAGDNGTTVGVIYRITGTNGFGSLAINVRSNVAVSNDYPSPSFTGVTTIAGNSLLLMCGASETTSGSDIDFTGYTVATSDPTWTEEDDLGNGGGARANIGVASATYATAGATGNFSVTADVDGGSIAGALVAITENINGTGTFTHIAVTPTLNKPAMSSGTTGTHTHLAVSPTINKPTRVKSEDKRWTDTEEPSASTWTDEEK